MPLNICFKAAKLFSRDPQSEATMKTFEESLDFAINNEFTDQDIVEAKLSVFQGVSAILHTVHFVKEYSHLGIFWWNALLKSAAR